MAAVATERKKGRGNRRWIIGGIVGLVLVGLCGGGAFLAQSSARTAAEQLAASKWKTAEVTSGTIDASVSGTGNVAAASEAGLQFSTTGTVKQIFVKEGDKVKAGQPLAQLDSADLELAVDSAQADLKQAKAEYDKLMAGATPEELAQAKAALDQARGQYTQTVGSVTKSDIDAAKANLTKAKEALAQLEAGPKSADQRSYQSALDQAQANLQNQRDSLSQAKTNAKASLDQAVNSLSQAQASYSVAKHNWDYVQDTGRDPVNPSVTGSDGKKTANTLNDGARQQYYSTYVQAETSLHNAESAVAQAQAAYDTARQNEIVGVQSAQQQLDKAQGDMDELNAGAKADELAAARAQVASAQAELDRLTGANRSGSLASARAGVASSEAALAKLTSGPLATDLATAEAGVARAEAALKRAQRNLEQATLSAPFDGTVAKINIQVGEPSSGSVSSSSSTSSSGSGGAIDFADLSAYHIDVPIDELDIAQVTPKQAARITLDAMPDSDIKGVVASIAPVATKNTQGTTTYEVTVNITPGDSHVMSGMTASVDIITQQKTDAVLVPRRAIQIENGKNYVWVPSSGQPDPATGRPASERRDVTLGLTNTEFAEVTSGLKAGDTVLVAEASSVMNPMEN